MHRFALMLACSAGFFILFFLLLRALTDVSDLRTQYPLVRFDPRSEEAEVEIVKQKPAAWVSLKEVSKVAWEAIVISEDAAFWTHNGFDWDQLWDAFETNLKKGRFARGGSTITQQVIKNVYLSNEKTILRKIKEAVLTTRIESHLSKKRILEIYLNIAEMGPGVYGIGHAARYYFQKPASQLTAKEGAFLAMLLPSPKRYSVSFRKKALTPYARSSIRGILGKLLATKRISDEEYEIAMATPFAFEEAQIVSADQAPDDEEEEPEKESQPSIEQAPQSLLERPAAETAAEKMEEQEEETKEQLPEESVELQHAPPSF